jgi:hypothetical protein
MLGMCPVCENSLTVILKGARTEAVFCRCRNCGKFGLSRELHRCLVDIFGEDPRNRALLSYGIRAEVEAGSLPFVRVEDAERMLQTLALPSLGVKVTRLLGYLRHPVSNQQSPNPETHRALIGAESREEFEDIVRATHPLSP